jgi:hypothetical protein
MNYYLQHKERPDLALKSSSTILETTNDDEGDLRIGGQ